MDLNLDDMQFDLNDDDEQTNVDIGVEQMSFDMYSDKPVEMIRVMVKFTNKEIPIYITTDSNIAKTFYQAYGSEINGGSFEEGDYYLLPEGVLAKNIPLLSKIMTKFGIETVNKSEKDIISNEQDILNLFECNYIRKQLQFM